MKELNAANHPLHVLQRHESGAFASSEATAKEYIKALVATGRLDSANLGNLTGAHPAGAVAPPAFSSPWGGSTAQYPQLAQTQAQGTFGYETGMMGAAAAGGATGGAGVHSSSPLMVKVVPNERTTSEKIFDLIKGMLPLVFLGGVVMYAMGDMSSQMGGGGKRGGGLLGMLSPKELEPLSSDVTFDDVKGCDEAKDELQEIADFLADPDKFTSLGGKLPKGVLLMGAPGTGKTLLARAIAGEAGVPFYYVSGAEFDEVFVGVGAKRVRELFRAAKANSPCIVFIDELDAVGGKRSAKDQRAMKQTVNQLLVELDGFEENEGLIVVGATNFPDSLDPALVRPGRFDRHVNVALPDIKGRQAILDLYMDRVTAERVSVDIAFPAHS